MTELSPQMTLMLLAISALLLVMLVVSILLRPRVFTQYLEHMSGIKLSAKDVARVYKQRGKAGVRELFLELIIHTDLKESPRITPDTPPDRQLITLPEEQR
jgi:hypothetical protein